MIRLKGCERCGGDLASERGLGSYTCWSCIQCGHECMESGEPEVSPHTRGAYSTIENVGRTLPKRIPHG